MEIFMMDKLFYFFKCVLFFHGTACLMATKDVKRLATSISLVFGGMIAVYYYFAAMPLLALPFFYVALILIFPGKKTERAGLFILIHLGIDFVDEVSAMIMGSLLGFNPLMTVYDNNIKYRLLSGMPSLVLLLWFTYRNRGKEKQDSLAIHITGKQYCLLLIPLGCVLLLVSMVSYIIFTENEEFALFLVRGVFFLSLFSVVMIVIVIFFVAAIIQKQQAQEELVYVLQKKDELQKEYYQRFYEKDKEMRAFRHDYHHHISYLQQQLKNKNYEKAERYLFDLNAAGEKAMERQDVYSGHSVIDAVINGILTKEENAGINFSYEGNVGNDLMVRDIDLCIVLANVLENAAEACRKCDDKKISMQIKVHNENIMIQVKNAVGTDIVDLGKTGKADKENHGYGIRNVRRVVEKYDGRIIYKEEKGIYSVIIQLNGKN